MNVSQWIRPEIRDLSAYHVPDAQHLIKLDAMENPYHWDEPTLKLWLQTMAKTAVNRYPDAHAIELKQQLKKSMVVPEGSATILGNGSDELIQMLMLAMAGDGHKILTLEPSFVMYKMLATITGMEYLGISLNQQDFSLNLPAFLQAIEQHQPALIFLAYPNNPTGNLFDVSAIERILRAAHGFVVIDEAYAAFADHSFIDKLPLYSNLLVMRTVSKIGLAGLRIGLLAGAPDVIAELEKVRLPYNINVLSQVTALFALQQAPLAQQTAQICHDRQQLFAELTQLRGVAVWPSQANFLLLRVNHAQQVFNQLKQQGILIKNLHGSHPLLDNCLRVTVGKPEENQQFLTALREIVANHG